MLEGFWYVMNDDRRLPPSQEYWDTIVEGYHGMGFAVTLLEKSLEKSVYLAGRTQCIPAAPRAAGAS